VTKKKKKDWGTSGGVKLTDELLDKWAEEAEAGYDISQLRPRPGRPPMAGEAATVFQVRLEPQLREALFDRAKKERLTPSEMARRLLRRELGIS
jgi:CRISPR-associated endonuclease/helicase Cas3